MQPHSMCAVALANIVWNRGISNISFCRLKVEYKTPVGTYKNNYYDLNSFKMPSPERFSISIKRSGGGLACTMNVKKDTQNKVEMTHETQHVAGLREEYRLEKKDFYGQHYNSVMYRMFRGTIKYDEVINFECEVLHKQRKEFVKIPYTVTIDTIKFS